MSRSLELCINRLEDLAEKSEGGKQSILTSLAFGFNDALKALSEISSVNDFDTFCDKKEALENSIVQIEQLSYNAEMIFQAPVLIQSIRVYNSYIKSALQEKKFNPKAAIPTSVPKNEEIVFAEAA